MKLSPDDVTKAFKGLAIAAARARELVETHGKKGIVAGMPRRQEDAIRQFVLDAKRDMETVAAAFQSPQKK